MRSADRMDLLELRGDPLTARYQSWSSFAEADAQAMIEAATASLVDVRGKWAQGAIARRSDDRLIGDCAIYCPAGDTGQSEIGFNLKTGERGSGYAAEAVGLLVAWLFRERRKRRVFAVTDRRNQPSRRLLERLAFRSVPEAYRLVFFKGEWEGEMVYERLR
jgi:RimJ/RimL family protein N-acetyltransferase